MGVWVCGVWGGLGVGVCVSVWVSTAGNEVTSMAQCSV